MTGTTTGNRLRLTRFLPHYPPLSWNDGKTTTSLHRTLARVFSLRATLSGAVRHSDIHACSK